MGSYSLVAARRMARLSLLRAQHMISEGVHRLEIMSTDETDEALSGEIRKVAEGLLRIHAVLDGARTMHDGVLDEEGR